MEVFTRVTIFLIETVGWNGIIRTLKGQDENPDRHSDVLHIWETAESRHLFPQ